LAQRQFQTLEVDLAAFGANFREETQQFLAPVCGNVLRTQVEWFGLGGHG